MFNTKFSCLLFSLFLTLPLLTSCSSKQPFYYDFETEEVLDTLSWKCKTIFALSDKYSVSGQKCLKMELYPAPYPGISLHNTGYDWSKHKTLCFNIHNQEKISLRLTVRIDDTKNPPYNNRYNNTFTIKPGMNRISIPLKSLLTSDTSRKLNLSKIEKVILFLVRPKERRVLYIDNVRLE